MLKPDSDFKNTKGRRFNDPGFDPDEPPDLAAELEFLFGRINYEQKSDVRYPKHFRLDSMRRLLTRIGNPQDCYQIVHVAGTKGKGSVCRMIASGLHEAGVAVGVYSSPHLQSINERIVVRDKQIGDDELARALCRVRLAVQQQDRQAQRLRHRRSSFFEMITAAALWHFADAAVQYVVLEVGLGGRLDSTNVCQPVLCLITNISLDHTRQLGNRLDRIAREKAGIIKPGVSVISGVRESLAAREIRETCAVHNVPLYEMDRDFWLHSRSPGPAPLEQTLHTSGQLADRQFELSDLRVNAVGQHQAENAVLAIAALQQLSKQEPRILESAIRSSLTGFRMIGRFEVLARNPLVVLDMAHNVASMIALKQAMREVRDQRSKTQPQLKGRRLLVFACSQDKDIKGMLLQIVPEFDRVLVTRFVDNPRAADPAEIAAHCPDFIQPRVAKDPIEAWKAISKDFSPADELLVTGSAFLIAEMRPIIQQWLRNPGDDAAGVGQTATFPVEQ